MGWTDEREALLKKLWLEGLSASQIAKQLGGVTRNAVIGKVRRFGLSGRATASAPRSRPANASEKVVPIRPKMEQRKPKRVAPPVAEQALAPGKRIYREESSGSATIHTLEKHMCKWPIGDPAQNGFTFCGKRTADGAPYCVPHAQVAYQPQQLKKKTPATELARSLRRYI